MDHVKTFIQLITVLLTVYGIVNSLALPNTTMTTTKHITTATKSPATTTITMNSTEEAIRRRKSSSKGIQCFKCNSWDTPECGLSVYKTTAQRLFPSVSCSDDCIKLVIKLDGEIGVIRGCSTGVETDDYTCDSDHCNRGTSFKTIYKSLITAILCTFFILY